MPPTTYHYDGTWRGLLCALYHAYEQLRLRPEAPRPRLTREAESGLFEAVTEVSADDDLARRVRYGIRRHGTRRMPGRLYRAFLSEEPGVEALLLDYLDALGDHGAAIERDVVIDAVREVERLAKKVNREVHRMHAFVRFEERKDASGDLWLARVEPLCNVLPLIGEHFTTRYPAQRWLIADEQRRLLLSWDTRTLELIDGQAPKAVHTPAEPRYQQLWRAYFAAVDIEARRNPRLQQRHIPHRYRRHLTEF